jgi:adenylate cyclase
MAEERVQRRLAAILAADVAGYSRLMGADEEATLRTLKGHLEIIDGLIVRHEGRVFGTAGDSVMAEFGSAVEAVRAAIAIQEEIKARNVQLSDTGMTFRIGVNLGDVMVEGDNLYGDGVNVAARIEGLCTPGEVYVSEIVQGQVEGKLSLGFDDEGEHEVKNIVKPVRVYRVRTENSAKGGSVGSVEPLALPDKPSIAVLPFQNMSGDPEQEYFSDGMTEDIITELSKISGLFVIARNSSFVYKGKPVSVKQVGQDLGVRYVLEGSVRKAGKRLRITAQLIDSPTDHHVWVERFDRELEDIFEVQDEVARKVAEELEVTLTAGESKRLGQAPTDNLDAYDLYRRARSRPYPPTQHNIRSGLTAYERVIQTDPNFAGGYAGKSMMHSMLNLFGHSDNPDADAETALELAQKALDLDPEYSRSHAALGYAYSALQRHPDAVAEARRAVELQPGDAESHYWYSRCLREAGFAEEACAEGRAAVRLDPQYFEGPYLNNLARAAFLAGDYQGVCAAYERNAAQGGPSYIGQWIVHAAAYSLSGETEKARQIVKDILRERPDFTLEKIAEVRRSITAPELSKLREGLKLVGLPEYFPNVR